jgi:hypothetical protein
LGSAADVDDFHVDTVLTKNPLLGADPQNRDFFAEGAMCDAHQRQLGGAQARQM